MTKGSRRSALLYAGLLVLLVAITILSCCVGAVHLSIREILGYTTQAVGLHPGPMGLNEAVFLEIRLPRVLLTLAVGAALSVSGALMQALFRNPIVEPGLIGTSAGAAFGAAFVFVMGTTLTGLAESALAPLILPLFAFAGSLLATVIVYKISTVAGKVTVATMLLAGIAINGLFGSGTGFFSYIAHDPQARSITFWSLGTFAGASWNGVLVVGITTVLGIYASLRSAKDLNALLLGESEASNLGVHTTRLKRRIMLINTVMVAVATALVGVIAFIGLVVPHIVRLLRGSDNRNLILSSALLGAATMALADTISRVVLAPAELPVGLITSFVGAPIFLWMLIRYRSIDPVGGFYA